MFVPSHLIKSLSVTAATLAMSRPSVHQATASLQLVEMTVLGATVQASPVKVKKLYNNQEAGGGRGEVEGGRGEGVCGGVGAGAGDRGGVAGGRRGRWGWKGVPMSCIKFKKCQCRRSCHLCLLIVYYLFNIIANGGNSFLL